MYIEPENELAVMSADLPAMLEAYRSRERGLPTYEELQSVAAEVESLRRQLEEAEAEIERAIRLTLNECFEYHSQVDARQHQKSIAEAVLAQLKEQKNG